MVTPAALPGSANSGAYPGIPGAATSFANTGTPLAFTVAAEDQFGNIYPSYTGTVTFASSDTAAGVVLPANSTLVNGLGVFSVTLQTPGNQTISATDINSGITGSSSGVVTRGLVVTSFATTPGGFVITFNKSFNPGAVSVYTTGSTPDNVILATLNSQVSVKGSVLFNANDTSITFVKTDAAAATGAFNPTSGLLVAGSYTVTLRSFSSGSGFEDALGGLLDGTDTAHPGTNYQITFTVTAPPVSVGIPDFSRGPSNTDAVFLPSTLTNGSTFALSYTNPAASPTTGTATVTFSTTATTLQSNIQTALTSGGLASQIGNNPPGPTGTPNSVVVVTNDVSTGANVLVTFQSALATTTTQLLSSTTPGVTVGLATINAANNIPGNGIPIALSSGLNVTSGSFTLQYNPSLLVITGVVSKVTVAGAAFTLSSNTINNATSATAVLSLSSPTRVSTTTTALTLGSLLATVPLSAATTYGAKQLLHFSSAQLGGTAGTIAVTTDDGVEVAAFFGDVTDTGGPFTLQDAGAIAAVAGQIPNTVLNTLPGFSAFANLDPVIVGDVSLQGSVNSTDAGAMNQQVGGTAKPTIPYAPIGLAVTPVGPDPALSVGTDLVGVAGGTVVVPVDIDTARPSGSGGMLDAVLALSFNPQVFEVTAADVALGTVPEGGSGWQVHAEVNAATGQIGIELFSNSPIQSTAGGSLVTIALHVREGAPVGTTALTVVPYVDPSGGLRVYQTQVSDALGSYVLHTAQTPLGTEPGEPGLVTIAGTAGPESSWVFAGTAVSASSAESVSTYEVQQTAVGGSLSASAGALPAALMEQVFGSLVQAAVVLQESAMVQPGAILQTESMERGTSGAGLAAGAADWQAWGSRTGCRKTT